jgi:hypothetical protein
MGDNSDCNCEQALRLQDKLGQAFVALLEARKQADAWLDRADRLKRELATAQARIAELERTWTVCKSCLYGATAITERAAIVSWLRSQPNPHPENHNDDIDCGAALQQGTHDGWSIARREFAAAIESLAHHHHTARTEGEP